MGIWVNKLLRTVLGDWREGFLEPNVTLWLPRKTSLPVEANVGHNLGLGRL